MLGLLGWGDKKRASGTLGIKQLRDCFRKDVLGEKGSLTFTLFWSAVALFAGDPAIPLDKPTSARNLSSLKPAYDFVCTLLADNPDALAVFQANATATAARPVPQLHEAVSAYLSRIAESSVGAHAHASGVHGRRVTGWHRVFARAPVCPPPARPVSAPPAPLRPPVHTHSPDFTAPSHPCARAGLGRHRVQEVPVGGGVACGRRPGRARVRRQPVEQQWVQRARGRPGRRGRGVGGRVLPVRPRADRCEPRR